MSTLFSVVYNNFLGKITDDMYMELTPQDTIKDLRNLLINSLSDFEFPRVNLYDYTLKTTIKLESELEEQDFVMGVLWDEIPENLDNSESPKVSVESSSFSADLSPEEINILAILMRTAWIQRQVASVENTRMKYSGPDFKMTSQANHLSKLLNLLRESQRESLHAQRLYKRRKINKDGRYQSNWSILLESSAIDNE